MPKKGEIKNRVGETSKTFFGTIMTIIEYKNNKDITVQFEDGYIKNTRYGEFISGEVRYPYEKSVFKRGYIGEGKYKVSVKQKHTIQYHYWYDMLKRCYDKRYVDKHNTYDDKSVCDEWLNFQNFARWFDDNFYTVDDHRMELDKDILHTNAKQYSPENCVFTPKIINTLFVKPSGRKKRKEPLSLGVTKDRDGSYKMRVSKRLDNDRETHRGFSTNKEAFEKYKEVKELYIKEIADRFKSQIPIVLYEALYRYEVVDIYGLS